MLNGPAQHISFRHLMIRSVNGSGASAWVLWDPTKPKGQSERQRPGRQSGDYSGSSCQPTRPRRHCWVCKRRVAPLSMMAPDRNAPALEKERDGVLCLVTTGSPLSINRI